MIEIIEKFYAAFAQLDAETMASCYHEGVVFHDPAFGELKGERAKDMWHMLCESQKGKDFRVHVSDIRSDGQSGSAHWEAHYHFSKTGRKVHNRIDARFGFRDGLIISHVDQFDLYKWSQMALGLQGTLIGWTPFFRKKFRQQANGLLDKYIQGQDA